MTQSLTDEGRAIRQAFYDSDKRRPYKQEPEIIKAVEPPGGDWQCVAPDGAICRSVMWQGSEVAHVNPRGDIPDVVEGQIAMAMRALPCMDAALRSIIVLAESAENMETIARLASSVIAYVEMPAPRIVEPDEAEEESDADVD